MTFDLMPGHPATAATAAAPAPAIPRDHAGRPDAPLGRIGSLVTRLAANPSEVRAAQRLRYRVFAEEMRANLPEPAHAAGLDVDRFDAICDHLVVIDTALDGEERIVATYRLLRQDVAERHGGFYSAGEYDIGTLTARHEALRFLELGRSCVLSEYRNRRTAELLWQGAWAYALRHEIDVMFGCASFAGTKPEAHALALSFLHHQVLAPEPWRIRALDHLHRSMDLMPAEAAPARKALAAMPPLIKGYLRLGAMVADGAVVDPAFGTTDVLIILPVSTISERYIQHYGASADRFAC